MDAVEKMCHDQPAVIVYKNQLGSYTAVAVERGTSLISVERHSSEYNVCEGNTPMLAIKNLAAKLGYSSD